MRIKSGYRRALELLDAVELRRLGGREVALAAAVDYISSKRQRRDGAQDNRHLTLSMGSDQTIPYNASRLTGPQLLSASGAGTRMVSCCSS